MADPVEVLDFWVDEVGPDGWYKGGAALDSLCRTRFADLWQAAHDGGLEHWVDGPAATLAYLVVTDQLSRNIHRNSALAFACDARALAAAKQALEQGWDMAAPEPERQFFYLPFEHSEVPADQALAVHMISTRLPTLPDMALHARAHAEIIRRFGRFPTRNAALGRMTTAEEQVFLDAGGYMAVVNALRSAQLAT
jgi:uncharacterized protein (DUF924 family)